MRALFIKDVLIGDGELERATIASGAAVLDSILGGVAMWIEDVLSTNLFDEILGGVPMRGSERSVDGAGVVLNVELDRLDCTDDWETLERETDRLLRLSARDDIELLLFVSMDTDGTDTEVITSSFSSSDFLCTIQWLGNRFVMSFLSTMGDPTRVDAVRSGDIDCGRALATTGWLVFALSTTCTCVNLPISSAMLLVRVADRARAVLLLCLRNKARLDTAVMGSFSISTVLHVL